MTIKCMSYTTSVCYSPNGKYIVSTHERCNRINIWDSTTGKIIKTLHGHKDRIVNITWTPNNKYIVSSLRKICISDLENCGQIKFFLEDDSTLISCVCYSTNEKYIIAGVYCDIKIWDSLNGELIKTLKVESVVIRVCYFSNDKYIISGDSNNEIRIYNTKNYQLLQIIKDAGFFYNISHGINLVTKIKQAIQSKKMK